MLMKLQIICIVESFCGAVRTKEFVTTFRNVLKYQKIIFLTIFSCRMYQDEIFKKNVLAWKNPTNLVV